MVLIIVLLQHNEQAVHRIVMYAKRKKQSPMTPEQEILYELLEDRYRKYNVPAYIDDDPIQILHRF